MRDYESRRSRFEEVEQAALKPLPQYRFEYGEWQVAQKVPSDYHIKVKITYSVPFGLICRRVEARVSQRSVEIYQHANRVATHIRHHGEPGDCITDPNHMPPQHLAYAKQGLEHYLSWATSFGPHTEAVVRAQYENRRDNSMIANKACNRLQKLATCRRCDLEGLCSCRGHWLADGHKRRFNSKDWPIQAGARTDR